MSQVLSQQEIDSLLEAMDNGEIDEKVMEETHQPKIKAYDFRRPVRLSKEYLSTIHLVFEDFMKLAVNQLSTQLRQQVEIKLATMEQISFDEFINSIPRFTLMGIVKSEPSEGVQIIELNPQMALQMVELLCGYDSMTAEGEVPEGKDSFTDIELAILEEVMGNLTRAFEGAWRDIVELDSKVQDIETNPQLLQTMSPNEPILLITFSIAIGNNRTFLNICIPYIFFEEMLDKLSFHNWFHTGKTQEKTEELSIKKSLDPVPLNLSVALGESTMTVENFLDMEVGDIIQLDKKSSKPLVMNIENRPYYLVKPGTVQDKMAVEVLQFIGGETENE
ncbi:flagellar motor switch protein FliM [Lacticigenium naphthae]|uniref:flagellar motor switch protein FliM n=1 Tax=Lacticigenium naphthae TaxID=515351 RepID=UPI0004025CB8|nr:flagellar motor switch protein FliM [Lacticigenium naphthae]